MLTNYERNSASYAGGARGSTWERTILPIFVTNGKLECVMTEHILNSDSSIAGNLLLIPVIRGLRFIVDLDSPTVNLLAPIYDGDML